MKKMYNAPVAEMMEFDYEENVTASYTPSDDTPVVVVTDKKNGKGDKGNGRGCKKC